MDKNDAGLFKSDHEVCSCDKRGPDGEGLQDGTLTISGEKKYEKEDKDENTHFVERSYGSFRRVLALPQDIDQEAIDAKFRNGVLTITVPRKQMAKLKEESKVIAINKAA